MTQIISRTRLFLGTVTAGLAGLASVAHKNPEMTLGELKTTALAAAGISAAITFSPEIYKSLRFTFVEFFYVALPATAAGLIYGTIKLGPIVAEELAKAQKIMAQIQAAIPTQPQVN